MQAKQLEAVEELKAAYSGPYCCPQCVGGGGTAPGKRGEWSVQQPQLPGVLCRERVWKRVCGSVRRDGCVLTSGIYSK